jgi:hypothetical protein
MKHLIRIAVGIAAALTMASFVASTALASGEPKNMPPFDVHRTQLSSGLGEPKNELPFTAPAAGLGGATEAAGYDAISRYLVRHSTNAPALTRTGVARLGARTEARGFRALVRYQESLAAARSSGDGGGSAISWSDVRVASALISAFAIIGAVAGVSLRRRHATAELR